MEVREDQRYLEEIYISIELLKKSWARLKLPVGISAVLILLRYHLSRLESDCYVCNLCLCLGYELCL